MIPVSEGAASPPLKRSGFNRPQKRTGRQGGLPSGAASVRLWDFGRQFCLRPIGRRFRCEGVVDRAPCHRVVEDPTKHLRVIALNLLDFNRNGFRQINPQIDGTRLPHRSTSNFANFWNFLFRMTAAIDGNCGGEISLVAAHKIGERADRVKRLRKLLRQRELAQNVLSDKELRDRFGCARPPFVTRKSPFCDAARAPEKRDCRTLFEVRPDGTCEFELPIKNICF
ncbi:MAG TPA: hypothetical protein VFZ04_13315 [Longimicrobiales bacterium]